jgi:hypothetical protein
MGAHSKFSSSAAERWCACPASIKLSEKAPPSRGSSYADEGTNAHACLEAFMKAWLAGKPLTIKQMIKRSYPEEMVKHCYEALQTIIHMAPENAEISCETKCSLHFIHEDMGGTTDCVIVELYGLLIVVDFKYGAMPVSAVENKQMISYALAIAHKYDYEFTGVMLVIIQPRALDVEEHGIVRAWETTIKALRVYESVFKQAAAEALGPKPRYSPSENNCKYCPAAPICPALREHSLREVQADFDIDTASVALPVPTEKPFVPMLGRWLTAADRLEIWIKKLREHAQAQLEAGQPIEGWKIVQKRSTRKWTGGGVLAIAKKHFGDHVLTTPELLSPAQFEKRVGAEFGKERAAKFTTKHTVAESSGTTMVVESDPRPAFNLFDAEFKELECDTSVGSAKKNSSETPFSSSRSVETVKSTNKQRRR